MKILVVGLGGVTAAFRNWPERIVALDLAKRGHAVRAIGTRDPARPALASRRETIGGVDVQRVRSGYWPNRELAAALADGPAPDLIHLMHPRNVLAAQVTAWAERRAIPTAYTWLGPFHDAYLVDDRERPLDATPRYERLIWDRRQLARRLRAARSWRQARDLIRNYRLHMPLARARHLIPCSEFEAQEMRRMGRQQPQTVVPLWIDLAAVTGEPLQPPALDYPRPWLLFVGQLTPRKGYDLALRAMPAILREHPAATLLMVSGINHAERAEVERIGAELGIADHIAFLGRVDDTALVNLFRACDAYLTPTRYEGFGLTLLEAMAAEAPIVASNIPVVSEIVSDGENGLLADYDSAEAVAAAALRILGDQALQARLRAGGRRTCEIWYNPTRLAGQLEAVYREVIDGAGDRRNEIFRSPGEQI
ncbi:MAG TPA: glycosyltransferase family 4 protein [Herpetosiphonaceae bacterium]